MGLTTQAQRPGPRGHLMIDSIFTFISFVEVEKGLDIGAVSKSSRPFHLL